MNGILILLVCLALTSAELINWQRDVDGVIVNEFVSIDKETEQILMSASDSCLKDTMYLQSVSLHDFKVTDSKGLVALKVWNSNHKYCFISDVAKSFDETKQEALRRRGEKKPLAMVDAKKYFSFGENDKVNQDELAKRSPALAEFCSDVTSYQLTVTDKGVNPKFADRFFGTLCFWYPFPILPMPWFPWPFFHPLI